MIVPARTLMPVVRASLERGQIVRITVNGASMLPFIRNGDEVELEPVLSPPTIGGVVLVRCGDERYVLHRVVRIDGESFFLRGDGQRHCEGPFVLGDVLGRVSTVYHNGCPRALDGGIWCWAGRLWLRSIPVNLWLLSVAILAPRFVRRISRRERRVSPGLEIGCRGGENR